MMMSTHAHVESDAMSVDSRTRRGYTSAKSSSELAHPRGEEKFRSRVAGEIADAFKSYSAGLLDESTVDRLKWKAYGCYVEARLCADPACDLNQQPWESTEPKETHNA